MSNLAATVLGLAVGEQNVLAGADIAGDRLADPPAPMTTTDPGPRDGMS